MSNEALPQTFGLRQPKLSLFNTRGMKLRCRRGRQRVLKSCDLGRSSPKLTQAPRLSSLKESSAFWWMVISARRRKAVKRAELRADHDFGGEIQQVVHFGRVGVEQPDAAA